MAFFLQMKVSVNLRMTKNIKKIIKKITYSSNDIYNEGTDLRAMANWQYTIVYKLNIDHIVKLVKHVSDSYKYFLEKENSFF